MALKNNYLTKARKEKNDEFYTQYEDVKSECDKFFHAFEGKTVYCPCDNRNSKFVQYFIDNFEKFKLKGLFYSSIDTEAAYYNGKDTLPVSLNSYGNVIEKVDIMKSGYRLIASLSDIIVTNPPFSLFNDFLNGLIEMKKDFLIIGQQNSISCKDVFAHLKDDGVIVDYGFKGIAGWFDVPTDYQDIATAGEHIEGKIRVSGVVWYTTLHLDIEKPFIKLKKSYYNEDGTPNNEAYPFYDNFRTISGLNEDCINVDKVKDIPCDYYGYMGVPISFFGKYNPSQFELIQLDHYGPLGNQDNIVNGTQKYRRLYVRLRKSNQQM